jgi:cell wall-associated NlpC family hydrolase
MKRLLTVFILAAGALASIPAPGTAGKYDSVPQVPGFWDQMKPVIERYLGKPYVWGASGLKCFDCSGFVWRVLWENGILIKRTTARKLYLSLPEVPPDQCWSAGSVVFFNDLKHCGIVAGPNRFYHSETSIGTNLSAFDPYWRPKIYGFRALPLKE